ncbi:MAG: hypothetical protein ACOX6T_12760 [Myxococcales bacterium]|jgi:hypothetical protein
MRLVAILVALLLAPACAQTSQAGQPGTGGAGAAGETEQLQGRVIDINQNQGTLTVASNGRSVELRGTPTQLERFSRDQQVTVQVQTFGNNKWLLSEGIGGAGMDQAATETISGTISSVSIDKGTVEISNRTFMAHPLQLQRLEEGQQVRARYERRGDSLWLQNIETGVGGPGQTGEDQSGTMQGPAGGGMQMGQVQTLQGQVTNVSPDSGTMTVTAEGRTITLRGTPTQLQRFSKNQQATVRYRTYGSTAWLLPEGLGGAGTGAGRTLTVSGTVTRINPEQGTITISNRTFNAHPDLIQQLRQGQSVTATYQAFGNNNWIQNVQGPQGGMQQGQGGAGTQPSCPQPGTQQGQAGMQPGGMQQAPTQTLQGRVVSVNPNAGTMTVSTEGRTMTVRGTPTQLQRYKQNQQTTIQFRTYGNTTWLVGEGIGGAGAAMGAGQTVTGSITQIDREQGTVVISNRTFNAHPDQIQQLQEGQSVSATYQAFGNNNWLQTVQGSGMQQGQGGSGMQPGCPQAGDMQGQAGGQQGQAGMEQMATQTVRGQVVSTNPNAGTMTLSVNGRTMTIRGTPTQLERFSKNQQATIEYQTFGSNAWLLSEGFGGPGTGAGRMQTITGSISRIDPAQGTVVISNRTFYAHPTTLQRLQQGQRVSATYQAYGNNNWLQSIQSSDGSMQPGGMQQGGMGQ